MSSVTHHTATDLTTAAQGCLQAYTACLTTHHLAILSEEDSSPHFLNLLQSSAVITLTAHQLLSIQSDYALQHCQLAAQACRRAAESCVQVNNDDWLTSSCAAACNVAAEACARLISVEDQ